MPDFSFTLLNSIGVMALVGAAYGVTLRRQTGELAQDLLLGLMFGFGAVAAMAQSITLEDGVFLDPRNLFLGFAGALLSPVGALLTFGIAALARSIVGGAGSLPGIVSMLIAVSMGLLWASYRPRHTPTGLVGLLTLGVMISCSMFAAVLLTPEARAELASASVVGLILFTLVGSLLFGGFLEREWRNSVRELALARQAHTDPLTGLMNRRAFEAAHDALAAQPGGRGLALVLVDLDHFKAVNDAYGHDAGDAVLRAAAQVIRSHARPVDRIARLGGEEFGILMPDCSRSEAEAMTERFRAELAARDIAFGDSILRVTASFGLHWSPGTSAISQLLKLADLALYRAKENGRNRVELSRPV